LSFRRTAILFAAAAVAALAASCAYFNIYWTAEREYEKATQGTVIAEFWDPYNQPKPTPEAMKNIDSCAKRCGKILLLYPKSRWVDDAIILMGNCFVLKGEYANGLRKYEELLKFYPKSELADQARYMKAYTQVLDGSSEAAAASLVTLADEMKDKGWLEHVFFLSGRVHEHNADYETAISDFHTYLARFPDGRRAADVTLALGGCLIKTERFGEAVDVLEPLAKKEDKAGMAGALAAIKLATAYRSLKDDDKALEVLRRISTKTTADSVVARADIESAITLDDQGKTEEAITMLTAADSLGKTALGGEARYRMGLIYEARLGDYAKATSSYDDAAKSPSEFGKLASKRGGALKAVDKYTAALGDSTVQRDIPKQAATRFLLAETYLLDLGLKNKAEEQFRVLADTLPSNPYTAQSMLALGSLLDASGDTLSRRYYRAVVDSFPTTVYANVARSRLDLPLVDVVITPKTPAASDTTHGAGLLPGKPAPEGEGMMGPFLPEAAPEAGPMGPFLPSPAPGAIPMGLSPPSPGPAPSESIGPGSFAPRDSTGGFPDTTRAPGDTTNVPGPGWNQR
jgi:TolA-binding protein